jgi:hypothetical protein
MQKHPEVMKSAFIYTPQLLDACAVADVFCIEWSAVGSTRHAKEKKIVAYWRDFLQDLEGANNITCCNFIRMS